MATDVERQIAEYFGWVERQAGVALRAQPVVADDEAATIAALERQLVAPSAAPRRHRRFVLTAAGALVVIGAAVVLLTWRDDDAGLIIDKPPVTSQPPSTVSTLPRTAPSTAPPTIPPASPPSTVPPTLALPSFSPEVSFDVSASAPGPFGPNTGDSAVFTTGGDTIIVRAVRGLRMLDPAAQSLGQTVSPGTTVTDAGDLAYGNGSLYDPATGAHLRTLPNARSDLRGDFSSDGTRIVMPAYARRGEATATVYDTATGEAVMDLTTDEVAITWAVYSPDGSRIMTLGRQGVVRIWDASSGEQLAELDDSSSRNAFSPDGSAVLSVGASGRVRVRDAVSGEPLGFDQAFPPGGDPRPSFSPDGKWIVVTAVDPADTTHDLMTVWDAATGVQVTSLVARAHTIAVRNLAWSADGRVLATVLPDGEGAAIWSIPEGANLATIALDGRPLLSIDIDADATRLVGLDTTAQIRIWDLR
jgi:hypothetical protein